MMGALLVIACGGSAGSAVPTVARPQGSTGQAETSLTPAVSPTVPVLSDSAIKSLVIVNMKSDPDATSAIPLTRPARPTSWFATAS